MPRHASGVDTLDMPMLSTSLQGRHPELVEGGCPCPGTPPASTRSTCLRSQQACKEGTSSLSRGAAHVPGMSRHTRHAYALNMPALVAPRASTQVPPPEIQGGHPTPQECRGGPSMPRHASGVDTLDMPAHVAPRPRSQAPPPGWHSARVLRFQANGPIILSFKQV